MCRITFLLLALWLVGLAGAAAGDDKVVRLATEDWPPYTIAHDPSGLSETVVREAFAAVGYRVEIAYLPWSRAVRTGMKDPAYAGYFPQYYSTDMARECEFSDVIGTSPTGFAERKADPLQWQTLDDLGSAKIGTVLGYIYSEDFDQRVASGKVVTELARTDQGNLKKLLAGRVRAAVIDRNVLDYYFRHDPELASAQNKLQFNDKLLADLDLFVCFRKSDAGADIARLFNQGLKSVDIQAVADRYFRRSSTR